MSLILDEHRQYILDTARVEAFSNAITQVVNPGDVVLDLGSGIGILGLLACRAGAKKVYCIDEGNLIELGREICHANGFQDRVSFIKGFSMRVELPEKVDVTVADQIGRFGFEAGVLQYFDDARKRFLKPAGTLIPSSIDLCVAPVECSETFARVEFWNSSPAGFNFSPARSIAVNTGYPVKLSSEQLLGNPAVLTSVDLSKGTVSPLNGQTSIVVTKAATLHGIGGWFSARLSKAITMSNSPLAANPINRMNVFFPIDQPVTVEPDDSVQITMQIVPSELIVTWKVEVFGSPEVNQKQKLLVLKNSFIHSTFHGMLISKEHLQRTKPSFVPKLSAWGDARRSVVNLCDGQRTLSDIEREIFERHSNLFPTLATAAEFVAEVVTRYSL